VLTLERGPAVCCDLPLDSGFTCTTCAGLRFKCWLTISSTPPPSSLQRSATWRNASASGPKLVASTSASARTTRCSHSALGRTWRSSLLIPDSRGRPCLVSLEPAASPAAGWLAGQIAYDDIDETVAEARSRGYDPGEVTDGQRVGPTGTVLRWRATPIALDGRLVPFLICWGDTEHPARSAPPGLVLGVLPDRASRSPVPRAAAHGPWRRRRGQASDGCCARGPPQRSERQKGFAMMPLASTTRREGRQRAGCRLSNGA
jgi:hypothetical protein